MFTEDPRFLSVPGLHVPLVRRLPAPLPARIRPFWIQEAAEPPLLFQHHDAAADGSSPGQDGQAVIPAPLIPQDLSRFLAGGRHHQDLEGFFLGAPQLDGPLAVGIREQLSPLSAEADWTCRVLAAGLHPRRVYWYRFTDEHGFGSRIG